MSYDNYVDPIFLDKITYIDAKGERRVKNPYRNRKSYEILIPSVNGSGDFIFPVPESVVGKSVFVEFPSKTIYQYVVSAQTNSLTIIGIPAQTYVTVNVVNPRPLPPTENDLYWDKLGYDAQKAIVAAWGDIELVCNVLYPSTVEAELNFDDQNTLKYGLVGWKNNCGNDKGTMWGRPSAPANGIYHPPQPTPTVPPELPPTTLPPGTDLGVTVCAGEIVEIGIIPVPKGFTGDLEITLDFGSYSGASFPDLNVRAPNGDTFGYTWGFLGSHVYAETTSASSCSKATYTGYMSTPETMRFSRPMEGNWKVYAQNWGGNQKSTVDFNCNLPLAITYKGANC